MEKAQFRVDWVPTAEVAAWATKRGMKPDDGTSFFDWCDPDEFEISVTRKTFSGALRAARQAIPFDVSGRAMIVQIVSILEPWGAVRWRSTAHWEVCAGDPDPTFLVPDWTDDLDLCEDEELIA